MNGNIALIAALPAELKALVANKAANRWRRLPAPRGVSLWEHSHPEGKWIAACAGMGPVRAAVAFAAAQKRMRLDSVCSIGWAGALDARTRAGEVRSPSLVIDTLTGERFRTAFWPLGAPHETILVTAPTVANAAEKSRLVASYGASLVDMEAATIARLAAANQLPFFCFKAVSDDFDAQLPDFNRFLGRHGQLRLVRFVLRAAFRPSSWPSLLRLGLHSSKAADHLAKALYDWFEQRPGTEPPVRLPHPDRTSL